MNKKDEIPEEILIERRKMLKIENERANNFINNLIFKMYVEYEEKLRDVEDIEDERK